MRPYFPNATSVWVHKHAHRVLVHFFLFSVHWEHFSFESFKHYNQCASVRKHFKSSLQPVPNCRKDPLKWFKSIFFHVNQAFFLVERLTTSSVWLLTCWIKLMDVSVVRLILRGLCYNQIKYFFLRKSPADLHLWSMAAILYTVPLHQ